MKLLSGSDIRLLMESKLEDRLFIDPILDDKQIGDVSVDLRLGYDFHVSVQTREPCVRLLSIVEDRLGAASFFQFTRREIGENFILYPGQIALTTTLEYIALPNNVYADILSRSSYTRLGLHLNTMVQPGFRGCFPLELFNHNNNPIELIVGARIIQARLFQVEGERNYHNGSGQRKYFGDVRPRVSRAQLDPDLSRLSSIRDRAFPN